MDRPYVNRVRIQNVGPIRDVTLALQPLHALIGPNDTGKSSVLRAIHLVQVALTGQWTFEPMRPEWERVASTLSAASAGSAGTTQIWVDDNSFQIAVFPNHHVPTATLETADGFTSTGNLRELEQPTNRAFVEHRNNFFRATRGPPTLRLDPDAMRRDSPLIRSGSPVSFADDRGTGLSAVYDAILGRNFTNAVSINSRVRELFPTVDSVQLLNPAPGTKALGIKLKNGTEVGTSEMSEGLLYYLAFACLPFIDTGALVLVEEPENGLHPARIKEVMSLLREISKKTQVLLATHSPLVINEMRPEEVTVLTRDPDKGTVATPIMQTKNFAERAKVYALGELWLSYANGVDESPLINGEPRP